MSPTPLATYKGENEVEIVRRFYQTATKLVVGQALCGQDTLTDTTNGLAVDVEIPNTNNETFFTGIVAPGSVGKTGPCMIEMYKPKAGDRLRVLCGNKMGIAVGDYLYLDFNQPTADDLGAFESYTTEDSISTDAIDTKLLFTLQTVLNVKAQGLEVVAVTTAASEDARALKWVEFVR